MKDYHINIFYYKSWKSFDKEGLDEFIGMSNDD